MKINVASLTVTAPMGYLDIEDDIDTGISDGGGTLDVRAVSAEEISPGKFEFKGVEIEATGTYAHWEESSLHDEARSMLEQDYITDEDDDDDWEDDWEDDYDEDDDWYDDEDDDLD